MNSISILKARCAGAFCKNAMYFVMLVATMLAAMGPGRAAAETRSLKVYYVHTGEKAEIAFKQNGRYLPAGLQKLNVFLRDWRHNEPTKMDPRLFDLIWQVYQATGSNEYITVVSAYRSPATNSMLRSRSKTTGVAKKSQHMLGRAMDYFIPGVPLKKLRYIGMRYQIGGVGYYPTSGSPFVHMDVGSVRHWPRMSRGELLTVFPDGKTVHIPTDGRPLPGYEQALASIEQRKASGGGVMMASATTKTRKSKTLFGALFGGGGADDEEDSAGDSGSVAVASAKPVRAAPVAPARAPAPAPVPEAPVAAPRETLVASLPTRDVPRPLEAPRPAAAVAEPEPENVPFATALNVPIPGRKPAIAPQEAIALAAAETEPTSGALAAKAAVDANTAQMADAGNAPAMLTGFVPVPIRRPQHGDDNVQLAAAVIPTVRPDAQAEAQTPVPASNGRDAIAELVNAQPAPEPAVVDRQAPAFPIPASAPRPSQSAQPVQQLALASPQHSNVGELIAPPAEDDDAPVVARVVPVSRPTPVHREQVALNTRTPASIGRAADTGVRTTAKGAKPHASRNRAAKAPAAVVKPATAPTSELAMSSESVSRAVTVTNPVLRNDALRSAPTMVYTAGFQRDLPTSDRASSFQGNAVTFLSVAKFSATN